MDPTPRSHAWGGDAAGSREAGGSRDIHAVGRHVTAVGHDEKAEAAAEPDADQAQQQQWRAGRGPAGGPHGPGQRGQL